MSELLTKYFFELNARLAVTQTIRREVDKRFSPDFNLFNLLLKDELGLSWFMRELLESNSAHGQQKLFRALFLQMIQEKQPYQANNKTLEILASQDDVQVNTEVQTIYSKSSQRRMDILIHNRDYGLMIENKPWAADQHQQITDYAEDLKKRFAGNFYIVYLSPQGTDPSPESISTKELNKLRDEQRFYAMSLRDDLAYWARRCAEKSESEKMRQILLDFSSYLSSTF